VASNESLVSTPDAGAGNVQSPARSDTVLELFLGEIRQLFDSMDPAPFRERDLDPKAAAYIVDWAREAPVAAPLSLVVHLGRASSTPDDAAMLRAAVHEYFRQRALATRAQLRQLFRTGRISLVIGLAFLGAALVISEFVAGLIGKESHAWLVKETLVIGGWVALWRPMEIFLYDWWPIRAQARLYERLGEMDVHLSTGVDDSAGKARRSAA